MARPKKQPRDDIGGNVKKSDFLEFFDELTAALRLKASAADAVATVYKRAEQAGIDRKQMKRAYQDNLKATDEREVDDRRYRQYLAWLGLPVGLPPDLGLGNGTERRGAERPEGGDEFAFMRKEADPAEAEAVERHEHTQAFEAGVRAGTAGANAASNPYDPGTMNAQGWSVGWSEGQREAVMALGGATRRRAPDAGEAA